jgi:hypothetical protein
MRNEQGAIKTVRTEAGAMYVHRLFSSVTPPSLIIPRTVFGWAPEPIASPDLRHAVYSQFLDALTLSPFHAAELTGKRGLSEETVVRNLYASAPADDELSLLANSLASKYDLSSVPGFWCDDADGWHCVAREGELLIPARDENERITAVLRGRNGRQPKYVWMSDAARSVSCGTPLHFALAYLADVFTGTEVVITEGVLKADILAEHLHLPVVGCPGTMIPDGIGRRLAKRFPTTAGALVAFDADEVRNQHVRDAVVRLLHSLRAEGIPAERLLWDEALGKGLDDVVLGGAK